MVVRDRFGPPCGVTAAGSSLAFRHGNFSWVWLSSRASGSGPERRRCNPCHPDACRRSSVARALNARGSSFARNRAVDKRLPTSNRRDAGSTPVVCMYFADVAQRVEHPILVDRLRPTVGPLTKGYRLLSVRVRPSALFLARFSDPSMHSLARFASRRGMVTGNGRKARGSNPHRVARVPPPLAQQQSAWPITG